MTDPNSVKRRLAKLLTVESKAEDKVKALQQVFFTIKGSTLTHDDDIIYEVIKYSQSNDVRIKKLVYLYLSMVGHINQDSILHATNSIHSDLRHPNPLVRGSTLRLLSDITLTSQPVKDFVTSATAEGLKDSNPFVRAIAVDAAIKKKLELAEEINKVLQTDSDPGVVVRCLDCKAFHGDNVQDLLLLLLERITMVDDFIKTSILARAQQCLQVKSEETMFRVLNAVEPIRKQTNNLPLSLEASALMLKVSSDNEEITKDVIHQTVNTLMDMLHICDENWSYVALCMLHFLVTRQPHVVVELLTPSTKMFLVQFGEPESIQCKKIDILASVVTETYAKVIFMNLLRCINSSNLLAAKGFALLTCLHKFLPQDCEKVLMNCMQSTNPHVVTAAIEAGAQIVLKQPESEKHAFLDSALKILLTSYKHCETTRSKCSCLWLISQSTDIYHCGILESILASEVENFFKSDTSLLFQQEVLASCIRLFLRWPHIFEKQLKTLFKKIFDQSEVSEIELQAKIYFLVLKSDLELATKLVEPSNHVPDCSTSKTHASAIGFANINITIQQRT